MSKRIFLSPPYVGEEGRNAVNAAFDSGYIAPCGPQVEEFERRLGALAGGISAAAVSGGTAAIDLLMEEFSVNEKTTVFCSDLTFIASLGPAFHRGANIVLIGTDATTGNLSLPALESALAKRSSMRACDERFVIIAVDLYGRCCDYDGLESIASRFGAKLIIDAAEAVGAKWKDRPAGSAGDAAIYSFNGNKTITTSGGGAVLSSDAGIVERARWRSQQSREPVAWYEHREVGYNYRLSNLLGALGNAQLGMLPDILMRKAKAAGFYLELMKGIASPLPHDPNTTPNNWLNVYLFDDGKQRDEIAARLTADNIECRPVWKPMHLQPVFADNPKVTTSVDGLDVSRGFFERGLCLPSGAGLCDEDFNRIAKAIKPN